MLNNSGEKKSYTLGHSFIYGEKKSYNSAKRNILSGLCKIRQFFLEQMVMDRVIYGDGWLRFNFSTYSFIY
jgi:hypothetical protein